MLLAVDECKESKKKCIGVLVLPLDDLPRLDSLWTQLRIKNNTWSEIKWVTAL